MIPLLHVEQLVTGSSDGVISKASKLGMQINPIKTSDDK